MEYDVISVGEPVIDFVPVRTGDGLTYKAYPGGGAVNVLAEVSAMGGSARLLGVVGQDLFGDFLLEQVKNRGIDVSGIYRTADKNTGIGFVQLSPQGERSFLSYRNYETDTRLYSRQALETMGKCSVFHFTSVSLVGETQRRDTFEAAAKARQTGMISFDVNYREDMWGHPKEAKELFMDCIKKADIVKLSEEEKLFLCGEADHLAAARLLCQNQDKLILISMGALGSYYYYGGGEGICPAIPVTAKDTTGCGDAFTGALLANLVPWMKKGYRLAEIPEPEIRKILTLANGAGAICATRYGSLSAMPYREEVERFITANPVNKRDSALCQGLKDITEEEGADRETVVILGAGLSGRGYLARQLDFEKHQLVFLDKDESLIHKLVADGHYRIEFFGQAREAIVMDGYKAFAVGTEEAKVQLRQASYLFICVGQQNLEEASSYVGGILGDFDGRLKAVIAAENGVDNRKRMEKHLSLGKSLCTECLMLCTTIGREDTLDIWSEDMDYLPYDGDHFAGRLPFGHLVSCRCFDTLVRRKIYTYNALSACIAYLGAYKGYTDYSKAATDPEIFDITEELEGCLNQAVCREYQVEPQEQAAFSALAKKKFRNPYIKDTIARNARNVARKIAAGERIAEPLRLMQRFGIPAKALELTAAAAFLYGVRQEGMEEDFFVGRPEKQTADSVMNIYHLLKKGISIQDIFGNQK